MFWPEAVSSIESGIGKGSRKVPTWGPQSKFGDQRTAVHICGRKCGKIPAWLRFKLFVVGLKISLFAGVSGASISCLVPHPIYPSNKPRVNEWLPCITCSVEETGSSCPQRGLGIGKEIRCVYK